MVLKKIRLQVAGEASLASFGTRLGFGYLSSLQLAVVAEAAKTQTYFPLHFFVLKTSLFFPKVNDNVNLSPTHGGDGGGWFGQDARVTSRTAGGRGGNQTHGGATCYILNPPGHTDCFALPGEQYKVPDRRISPLTFCRVETGGRMALFLLLELREMNLLDEVSFPACDNSTH